MENKKNTLAKNELPDLNERIEESFKCENYCRGCPFPGVKCNLSQSLENYKIFIKESKEAKNGE